MWPALVAYKPRWAIRAASRWGAGCIRSVCTPTGGCDRRRNRLAGTRIIEHRPRLLGQLPGPVVGCSWGFPHGPAFSSPFSTKLTSSFQIVRSRFLSGKCSRNGGGWACRSVLSAADRFALREHVLQDVPMHGQLSVLSVWRQTAIVVRQPPGVWAESLGTDLADRGDSGLCRGRGSDG